jgi:hypothetical protein
VTAPTWRRRIGSAVQWTLPAAILAIIPKCPVCFAGYVLLLTGVGLSMPAAAAVRWTLIVACAGALLFLAARVLRRAYKQAWSQGRMSLP